MSCIKLSRFPQLFLFTLFCLPINLVADDQSAEDQTKRLESLRVHIKETEKARENATSEKQTLVEELKQNEIRISEIGNKINQLKLTLEEKNSTLSELKLQEREQRARLEQERTILARQIRSAYLVGRNDYLKLLLNQQDPARVSRVLAYYDYHNRSRSQIINTAMEKLQTLHELEQSIADETIEIQSLHNEQQQRKQDYSRNREQRQTILLKLDEFIDQKDQELAALHSEVKELSKLLKSLDQQRDDTVQFYEDIPPFKSMRGKMPWPIQGPFIQRFGSPKKGGDLKWNGVLIKAKTGTDVKAINNGKVVFADWFKNLGMLIIVDHGNDYMSLYAHNESLYKKQDDWVLAGETIASVGDSGGQSQPGLYFEIRQQGKPVNPGLWCKK